MQLKKMKAKWTLLLAGLALITCIPSLYADSFTYTFELIPENGVIEGLPGSTIGWGYQIENKDDTKWLSPSSLAAGTFINATPGAIFDFPVLAPGATLSVPFDGIYGLYEISWDLTAPVGFVNSGSFIVSADWYDGDPASEGNFLQPASDQTVNYSATVAGSQVPVPEPASVLLIASGLIGCAVLRKALDKC
jgi:hypothetical protein